MRPNNVAFDVCRHYVVDLGQEVDPVLVKMIDGLRRSRDIAGLASCSRHFDCAKHSVKEFRFLRQIEAFFKKNSQFVQPEVCSKAAEDSFKKAEIQCSRTNNRLRPHVLNLSGLRPQRMKQVMKMKQYIGTVLGNFSPFLDSLPSLVRVTPGATAHTNRRRSLPQLKLKMKLYAPRKAHPYLKSLYHFHGFSVPRLVDCHTNRVELVPKNWKTDRTIACEPEGVLPLQLAFDSYAKKRLRFYGIDLSDQSANKRLAKVASIDGSLATVDFSAALAWFSQVTG